MDSLLGRHLALRALNDSPPPDAGQLEALRQDIDADARGLLATEGYFAPHLTLNGQGDDWACTNEPGLRTRIGKIALQIDGWRRRPGRRRAPARPARSLEPESGCAVSARRLGRRQTPGLRAVQIDQYPTARWASTKRASTLISSAPGCC